MTGRDLLERVIATVAATPGMTTNALVIETGVRRSDGLRAIRALAAIGVLRGESAARGARCWFVAPDAMQRFPATPETGKEGSRS